MRALVTKQSILGQHNKMAAISARCLRSLTRMSSHIGVSCGFLISIVMEIFFLKHRILIISAEKCYFFSRTDTRWEDSLRLLSCFIIHCFNTVVTCLKYCRVIGLIFEILPAITGNFINQDIFIRLGGGTKLVITRHDQSIKWIINNYSLKSR